jgi:hypothetical protein
MTSSLKPGSFEDFVRWLGEVRHEGDADLCRPDARVLSAATEAWQECQSLQRAQREAIVEQVRSGRYVEELELLAAADADRNRWLPRLRTPSGFAISALYAANSAAGAAPVGLLVECPADLIEVFRGQKVDVSVGGRWVEIGEMDIDGKATGDLPQGLDFRPPFAFRVGELGEHPAEPEDPNKPK